MTTLEQEHKDIARRAIEEVCARGDFAKAERYYSPHFRDRVNVSDNLSLLRQLGPWRVVALLAGQARSSLRGH